VDPVRCSANQSSPLEKKKKKKKKRAKDIISRCHVIMDSQALQQEPPLVLKLM
jgi:hypothetical protein